MGNPADAFISDAGQNRSLDASIGSNPGNSQIKFAVVGTATGAHTYDQAAFFSQLGDVAITAGTYVLGTVTPSQSRFSNAQVADFLTFNPLPLRNINIVSVAGTDAAAAASSIEVMPFRVTPMGQSAFDTLAATSFQTATDFQTTRVQIPLALAIDGYTYVRIVNNAQAAAVTYTASFTFGPRLDRRLEIPEAGAAVINSPGARR